MKLITVKQNSKEWREWRGKGLGASDIPALMGESPWTSPFELWLQKTGLMERPPANEYQVAAMRRGTELEPVVREMFEKLKNAQYPAVSAEHDQYEFLRVSFDGYNRDLNRIVEIKCPNKDDHAKAMHGQVPTKYISQVQQQLMISGAELCYYVSWDGKSKNLAIVEVRPDLVKQQALLETAIDFWKRVQNQILPDVTPKDVSKLVQQLAKHSASISKLSSVLELITKE